MRTRTVPQGCGTAAEDHKAAEQLALFDTPPAAQRTRSTSTSSTNRTTPELTTDRPDPILLGARLPCRCRRKVALRDLEVGRTVTVRCDCQGPSKAWVGRIESALIDARLPRGAVKITWTPA